MLVPDWRSDGEDGGRAELLASFEHARRHAAAYGGDPERFVLAGWSLGGREAVALATHPDTPADVRPTAVVGIASSYVNPACTTGDAPLKLLADRPSPIPVWLVHGSRDELVPAERTLELARVLPDAQLLELDSDHAGVVMTEFDPAVERCRPALAGHAVDAGRATARVLARAAGVING